MGPEARYKVKIMKGLKELPASWFFKSQEVSVRGIPDIIGCVNGHFVAIELKASPKAHITKLQKYVLDLINKAGGVGIISYPENYEETLTKIRKLL